MATETDPTPPCPEAMDAAAEESALAEAVVPYGQGTGNEDDNVVVEVLVRKSRAEAKRDVRKVRALARDLRAVRMRLDGVTFDVIAKKLGYGHRGNASAAVKRRLAEFREQCGLEVADLRQVETMRLDVALSAIMREVRDGNFLAIDRLLRIQERRAALEGLDQPKALKVEVARELEDFLDRLRDAFDGPTYERILSVFAGELGQGSPGGDPPAEDAGGGGAVGGGAGEGAGSDP